MQHRGGTPAAREDEPRRQLLDALQLRDLRKPLSRDPGGGSVERGVSVNLIRAIEHAKQAGATVLGIVGRDGGYTAEEADVCVVVPPLAPQRITPHTEGLCAVLWHLLVSHPELQVHEMKWESVV